ncbi:hypothetical protein AR457_12610 [Streptomyces agglomeratus]|uniref:Integral membrane protein n=1 Tax=Streptomyces agglomeratus TaxID=285458 RepID=A0A1E5P6J8_9ACTN|nr:DUF6113 family protein [Streptomyces agglomeratus]OEJ25176.1 hypothetical protein AS594_12460 [Streptomyces agglomeratus]OEJ40794.1 hypothetical protein BGK70_24040 [Streptomyces agglomeratus]OEJ44825.1 hypothetical protein AR457_12610 [Streptomyces agglomeratus]OEJ53335.1 hypothetical protein BGK72_23640 [Streptomyces agglomeratus]OEJ60672.1 hypothetical protein BGM19_24350 [Streptomyces agglomeratus]
MTPTPARIGGYVLLVLLGAVTGAAGVLVHAAWFPGGLLLSLLAAAGVFYGGMYLTGTKSGVGASAAGWLVAIVLLTVSRPEGDLLIGGSSVSYAYMLGGMAIAVICATMTQLPQQVAPRARLGK